MDASPLPSRAPRDSGPIEVVCFDLGGVLIRICRSWQEAARAADLPVHPVPEAFEVERQAAARAHQVGAIEDSEYYAAVSRASAGAYRAEDVERVHHAWTRSEYDGLGDLFGALRQSPGIRLACLSNTNAAHWGRLAPDSPSAADEYPNLAALETKLASHLLGLAKPDPEIFSVACARLETLPGRILFFDDLAENVAAARAAGWQAHEVDPFGDPVAEIRTHLSHWTLI